MIRLLGAEVTRLFSRRFTLIALILLLLAIGAFQLVVDSEVQPPSASELAAAQVQFEESHADWEKNHEAYEKECVDQTNDPTMCAYEEPTVSDFTYQTPFAEIVGLSLNVSVYLVALGVFMVAGTYIGAEYASGSISNWLTFIPQRGRVFAAKVITIAAFGAAASLVVSGFALGAGVVLAKIHDVQPDKLATLAGTGARGIVISVLLGVIGFCIGMVSRHTAAAVGVLLGYLFVWFVRVGLLSGAAWAQRLTPWTPEGNIAAIVDKKYLYSIPVQTVTANGVEFTQVERAISLTHGLVYWAVVVAVVVVGTLVVFRRRDVN